MVEPGGDLVGDSACDHIGVLDEVDRCLPGDVSVPPGAQGADESAAGRAGEPSGDLVDQILVGGGVVGSLCGAAYGGERCVEAHLRVAGAGLDSNEKAAILELRERFTRFFTVSMNDAEVLLFRLSYTDGSPERSMRRDIDDVFSVA